MTGKKKSPVIRAVVCAVADDYEICVTTSHPSLVTLQIGGELFMDDDNGVMRSSCPLHKFRVPSALLNRAKRYTVDCEVLIKRLPYRSLKAPTVSAMFDFHPLPDTGALRVYHLSDVHGLKTPAIKAGTFFDGAPDLLILNGDISSSTQTVKEALLPIGIAWAITKGERPCVITRGNHDLRGKYAERLSEFYPTYHGCFYYPVDLGRLQILVLDCGEDKDDCHIEYAGTVAFHPYRMRETAFLRTACKREAGSPEKNGKIRFVLSHIPFMHTDFDPKTGKHEFDIEQTLYQEWVDLLNRGYRPHFGLFGHIHVAAIGDAADAYNQKGFLSPLIIGGRPEHERENVIGAACTIDFEKRTMTVRFTDSAHKILNEYQVPLSD